MINKIILYKGRLVIGSVSSSIVSNCVMNEFDNRLFGKLSKIQQDFKYTRYADDIVISSNNFIPNKVLKTIDLELQAYDMKRNERKTYFMSKSMRKIVTGVTIDNNTEELSIGHRNYRNINLMKELIGYSNKLCNIKIIFLHKYFIK